MARLVIWVIFILLFWTYPFSDSCAEIYKWVDPSGTTHFSDNFEDIPPAYRNNFKIMMTPQRLERTSEIGSGIIIPFERTTTGLISVEAVLNDRVNARMIFDTGSNLVVITEELSKKLNQDVLSGDEVIRLNTNCGEVEGKSLVIQRIELGNARKENVRSVITPNHYAFRGFDGLLGLSFLGDFKVTVDYQNGKIILSK